MKSENHIFILYLCIILVVIVIIGLYLNPKEILSKDVGEYDYCVEWDGFIDRENLFLDCYDLVTQEFLCDYKIMKNNQIMFKPILNITKNKEGEITEIIYNEPRYFNCTRWLKSRR